MKIKIIRDGQKGMTSSERLTELLEKGKITPTKAINMLSDTTKRKAWQCSKEEKEPSKEKEVMSELNRLIGLQPVKGVVRELRAFVKVQKLREKESLRTEPQVLHMIFKGNPGTGKTTVGRILGKLFKELGVLSKGHLLEIERADLVGEYIGHTAQKTREQLKKAFGGVLFIDEAYSLARGGEKDFGKEAVDTLVKAMEDHKDDLLLILAGYQEEMEEFIRSNPGLRSRFAIHIDFPDYTQEELLAIGELMLAERQYKLSALARESLKKVLEWKTALHEHEGNARMVRNIVEKAIRLQAVRLIGSKTVLTREELMTILPEDIEGARENWLRSVL